eukprot:5017143-Heterocapsa_arctica.AAC.1
MLPSITRSFHTGRGVPIPGPVTGRSHVVQLPWTGPGGMKMMWQRRHTFAMPMSFCPAGTSTVAEKG